MPNKEQPVDRESYIQKANIVKAMAHPSRLMMIDALAEGEKCVCELQRLVGSDMSTVSKHLTVMKQAGIVTDRKEGLQVFYRLREPCVLRFFDCVDAVLRSNAAETARNIRE
jgi:ArsR family transcriptional regulator